MTSRSYRIFGALTLGALLGAAALWLAGRAAGRADLVVELARAGVPRATAGRLSIDVAYRPCGDPPAAPLAQPVPIAACPPVPTPAPAVLDLTARVARVLRTELRADALHAAGLLDLLWGDAAGNELDRSLYQLGAALRLGRDSAAVLTDLAAAHLARAGRDGTLRDLLEGAEAAERALRGHPRSAAAAYNRALALELLGLSDHARAAWAGYLERDARTGWAAEAQRRLAALRAAADPSARPAQQSAEPALPDTSAPRDPQTATLLGWDRLLPEWGAALLAGDDATARAALERVERIAAALVAAGRDASLSQATAAIRAAAAEPARQRRLAAAHRAYGAARERYRAGDYEGARPLLEEAAAAAAAGSALARWTGLFHAAVLAYAGRSDEGARQVETVAAGIDPRHPALAGRARWVLGTIRFRRGEYSDALRAYTAALSDFERAGEHEHLGAVRYLAAELELTIGNANQAHELAHEAVIALRAYPGSVWRYSAVQFLAQIAAGEGLLDAAVLIQDEAIGAADATGVPIYAAEARLARARLRAMAGEPVRDDLDAVRPLVRALEPPAARAWMLADLRLAEAIDARPHDPRASAAALDSVVAFFADANVAPRLLSALTARADARLAAGDTTGGAADLRTLVALLHEQRAAITRVPLRATLLEDAASVFERMALLHVAAGRAADALDELQRGRQSTRLLEPGRAAAQAGAQSGVPPPGPVAATVRGAAAETVLQLALLGDSLLAWTVVGPDVRLAVTPVRRDSLLATLARARSALELRAAADVFLPPLAELYAALIAPAAANLHGDGLVIVPYGELADVPFAALRDEAGGTFLVERWRLRFAASVAEARAVRPARRAGHGVTVVADPAFDPSLHPGLRRLPGAAVEAVAIGELYPSVQLVAGVEARREEVVAALAHARIAHYAGHAVLDDARPERSHLVLADGAGARPASAAAGRLTAEEIARLDLSGLELVVLSACRTLESRARRGHGFAALADAFLGAGAGGVVGAIWRVDDQLTTPVMTRFHRSYAAGRSAADALRDAQLDMIRSPDATLRSPAVWGAFRYAGH